LTGARIIIHVKHTTQYTFDKKSHLTRGGGQISGNNNYCYRSHHHATCGMNTKYEVSGASRNKSPASIRDMSVAFGFTFPGYPRTWGTPQ
jgi:hypothetical protein